MTPKYWLKIVLGMVVIVVIGLFVKRGLRRGETLIGRFENTLPLASNGFRLDGDQVGDIQRLQLLRSTPGITDSAIVSVKFTSAEDAKELDGCVVRIVNGHPFNRNTKFECTDDDDSTRLALVRFGHLEVMPEGTVVPLYVAKNTADDIRAHAYGGAGGDSGDVDLKSANGTFSVTVGGKELVHVSGDSNAGSVIVRGSDGKPIVEINGDSSGHGSIRVMDKDGKTRVNISGRAKRDSGS